MSLLTASNLAKSFGPDDLFSGVSLGVPRRARIGLVGPNGVGKTTLLRILAGLDAPSEGVVHRARELHSEYLPQEADFTSDQSLMEICLQAFAALREMESELRLLEKAMEDPQGRQAALARYGPAQEAFERQGGYTYALRIEQTLTGLGFLAQDYQRPLQQLSGGQRTRALLARLLLSEPDLLILDEPTNHLDITAVEWLENHLRDWPGGAIIVSHDRYFLDRVVGVIWEMSPMGFETYRGNYSAYLGQREARWAHREQIFASEMARLEKELDYVRRNIAGQRTSQAQGKLRRLSRQIEAVEKGGLLAMQGKQWARISEELEVGGRVMRVEEAAQRLKAIRPPRQHLKNLNLNLSASGRSGDLVLRTRDLVIGYRQAPGRLFHVPDLVFQRGECAAVIGPNGAGKTTFLKTLLGDVPPLEGELILGASLEVGYFAQAHEELNPQLTLMAEIRTVAPELRDSQVRDLLARYLFTGDEVFKTVAVLSGGERGRLALAKLSMTSANLLLLDEPTNHLDIPSQEILQSVLTGYGGTILLVSHDRYLIDAIGTQIWEIQPNRAEMTVFQGGYSQYRGLETARGGEIAAKAGPRPGRDRPQPSGRRKDGLTEHQRRTRLKALEQQIHGLEERLAHLGGHLADPPADLAEVERLGQEYVGVQGELDRLMEEWERLM